MLMGVALSRCRAARGALRRFRILRVKCLPHTFFDVIVVSHVSSVAPEDRYSMVHPDSEHSFHEIDN